MNIDILGPLANHLWQSTLFVTVVWLLTLALRRNRAAVRHRLWLAASLKFIIPFSLLVNLGSRIPWRPMISAAPASISMVVETISQPFVEPVSTPAVATSLEIPAQRQPNRRPGTLISLWTIGFVISVVWWLLRWLQLHRVVRGAVRLNLNLPVSVKSCRQQLEPGVFGVLRPVLLLPEGIMERLSQEQLDAVIAHELCHLRRRDNLTTAIHMFVEALFWFHPLVWWIRVRLIDEQERACDEEVLSRGIDRHIYAESILKICEFYLTAPRICVSGITRSNLKKRIGDIMGFRIGVRLSLTRTVLLAAAALMTLAAPVAVGVVEARESVRQPERLSTASVPSTVMLQPATKPVEARPFATPQIAQGQIIRGTWEIENPAMVGPRRNPKPDKIQFTLDGRSGKSFDFDSTLPFRDLNVAQISSPVRIATHFQLDTEAGTFICDGDFISGHGTGSYSFYPDAGFLTQMTSLGFPEFRESELVSMALHGVGPRFLGELRSTGIAVPTFDQLMGMRAVGMNFEYIRAIQQAGYTPTVDELISGWVNGVTPEFASEIRQGFLSASINDVIGLRVNGVTATFARDARQSDPSISIGEVVGLRFNGSNADFGRYTRQAYIPPTPAGASSGVPRTWVIESASARRNGSADRLQLTFFNPRGGIQSNSVPFDPSVFQGLTAAQLASPTQTQVRFNIVRDAGTFVCEGYFQAGRGSGRAEFQPNPDFRTQLEALGIQDIDDHALFTMALVNVDLQFARELRAAGVAVSRTSQLLTMQIQNVLPEYVREILQLYPSVSNQQLINMRVQSITPEFAREMRKMYPSASINDLINMKVQQVTPEFAHDVLQTHPSASIRDLVDMKIQGTLRRPR
jgi:beta-lactamase regulating signal transducer with metallopeptidase domain